MTVRADSFRADFRTAPGETVLGSITAIRPDSVNSTSELSRMGKWSFEMAMAAYRDSYVVEGYYLEMYSITGATEVLEFSGFITDIDDQWYRPSERVNVVLVTGRDDLFQLAKETVRFGEIYELQTVAPLYVGTTKGVYGEGDVDEITTNVTDNDTGTSELVVFGDLVTPADKVAMLYIGNDAPFTRVDFTLDPAHLNGIGCTLNVQICHLSPSAGKAFLPPSGGFTDTITVGGAPFAQSGYISWGKEQWEIQETHDGKALYWMRIYITDIAGGAANITGVGIREITVQTAGPHSGDVTQVMTYAPSGWSLHASSETATQEGYAVPMYGDSVLGTLFDLHKRSGEPFALSGQQEVRWFDPNNLPSSGITAVENFTTSSGYCFIRNMRRHREYREVVTRVYPRGAGDDEVAGVTISDLATDPSTGNYRFTVPSGWTVDEANNYIANTPLETQRTTDGLDPVVVPAYVDFPNIAPMRGGAGHNRQTADEVAKAAIAHLQRHGQNLVYYSAEVVGLDYTAGSIYPGMTMVVDADIRADNNTVTEAINDTLVIISLRRSFDKNGTRFFNLKLSPRSELEPSQEYKAAVSQMKFQQKIRHPQSPSSAKLYIGIGGSGGGGGSGTSNTGLAPHLITGGFHTVSGTEGQVVGLTATDTLGLVNFGTGFSFNSGTDTYTVNGAAITTVNHSNLTNVTANQHHNQQHGIVSSDHTVTGSANQIVGLTGTNTLGLLTPTSNALVNPAQIMISDANGDIEVRYLTASRITIDDVDINTEFSTDHIVYQNDGGDTVYFGLSTADDSWATPSYSNSWVDFDASTVTQYRLLPDGTVILNIHAKNGTNNTTAFNVAAKYRPQKVLYFPAIYNNQNMARVTVNTSGNITLYYSGGITSGQLFAAQCVYSVL